jgi:hypothetical protein
MREPRTIDDHALPASDHRSAERSGRTEAELVR